MKAISGKGAMLGAAILVCFTIIFAGGCSHKVLVAPHQPAVEETEKIPLNAGLYVSESFQDYTVSEYRMGDRWDYTNLGEASAIQFQLGLNNILRSVERVQETPPLMAERDTTIQVVVEPQIQDFSFDIPFTKFQVYPARINYRLKVYDRDGKVIFEEVIQGIGDTKGRPGYDFTENPARSASNAIVKGVMMATYPHRTFEVPMEFHLVREDGRWLISGWEY